MWAATYISRAIDDTGRAIALVLVKDNLQSPFQQQEGMCGLSFYCFYAQLGSRYKIIRGKVKQIKKESRLISIPKGDFCNTDPGG